jgi:hypothetical protein
LRTVFYRPNYSGVDDLLLKALERRGRTGRLDALSDEPAVPFAELMKGVSWSGPSDTSHYGRVASQLAAFVYTVCAPAGIEFGGKAIWGVDIWKPAGDGHTAYLAVTGGHYFSAPVLVQMPTLQRTLLHGEGTVADSRRALHELIRRIIDMANAALPLAAFLAGSEANEESIFNASD